MLRPFAAITILLTVAATSVATASPDDSRRREVEVEAALVAYLGDDARSIRAVVIEGHVLLVGTVHERVTQELSKEVALSLAGVERATSRVVALNDPTLLDGKAMVEGKDAELEIKVKRALSRDAGDAVARALEVEAVDGVVCLRGSTADAAGHDRAIAVAANVPGVVRVLDLVRPAG